MLPHSPFSRADAYDYGIRPFEWRQLVHEGRVREVYPGLYVDANLADTVDLRFAVIRRVLPEDAIVCRRSAAWLHGLDVLDHRGFPATPPVEVLTSDQKLRSRSPLVSPHVADDLLAADVMEIERLRVTSPLRTAADLARLLPRWDALVSTDAFLHRELISVESFENSLVRWRRRRGIRQAWEMVALADGKSESGGESRMRLRVLDMGLPRPELQIPVEDMHGAARFRLDMGWRFWRLALEYDGEEFHGDEFEAHDEARRQWIRGRGWTVGVFRKEHIFAASPVFEEEVNKLVTVARSAA